MGLCYSGSPLFCHKEFYMRTTMSLFVSMVLLGASSLALAHNCPNEMKAIDAKLATKPMLSADAMGKVTKLRADGETQHKAGKHDDSMKSLAEAKKLLGL
jgi:hypothetical protein